MSWVFPIPNHRHEHPFHIRGAVEISLTHILHDSVYTFKDFTIESSKGFMTVAKPTWLLNWSWKNTLVRKGPIWRMDMRSLRWRVYGRGWWLFVGAVVSGDIHFLCLWELRLPVNLWIELHNIHNVLWTVAGKYVGSFTLLYFLSVFSGW